METELVFRETVVNDQKNDLLLVREYEPSAYRFLNSVLDINEESIHAVSTTSRFNIDNLSSGPVKNIINVTRVNDVRFINKFFETVNGKLEEGGKFIGCFESKQQRKERIFNKYPLFAAYIFYLVDFIWKRVFPKVWGLKNIYFGLTRGHNRVITLPEVLGRLSSCGFTIETYREINNRTYFCVQKKELPAFDKKPTYGPLITLDRVGQNGEIIKVYKIRTMHPYAEYLQGYIHEQYDLEESGKFNNDFRKTSWGEVMRKFWLDELPMIWNLLKGELKLFGVRPISRHYFELYPEDFRQRRMGYKPGLVPPYYVDMPESFDEIIESEKRYLNQYDREPLKTDIKYFCMACYNIIFKKARSN